MAASRLSVCSHCFAKIRTRQSWQHEFPAFVKPTFVHPASRILTPRFPKRHIQSQQFKPFVPPSPSSLPKAAAPKTYRRTRKWTRRLLYLALGLGVAYEVDQYFLYASLSRSARTFWLGLLVATDYKINFRPHPPLADSIQALHSRNAERLFDLLRTNGGLYLKIGQAIAMQVDAESFDGRGQQIAEHTLVSYPAPRVPEDVL